MTSSWKNYEEVAAYLLNKLASEFGFERVEGKQDVIGARSGSTWEIDAKGFCKEYEGFIIIECRRYLRSKQNQERIGGLAYRILDTGARGGIVVSPLGFQEGALKVASAENIIHIKLNENCTPAEFSLRFLDKVFASVRISGGGSITAMGRAGEVLRKCKKCGKEFKVREDVIYCASCR